MKKRIIAALTALVMVVTMIPASAFASTDLDALVKDAKEKINLATANGTAVKFTNENLAAIDEAQKAVVKVGPGNLEQIKNLDNLNKAIADFNKYLAAAKAFNDSMAKIKDGTLTEDSGSVAAADGSDIVTKITAADAGTYAGLTAVKLGGNLTLEDINGVDAKKGFKDINLDNVSPELKDKLGYDADPADPDNALTPYTSKDVALVDSLKLAKALFGSNVDGATGIQEMLAAMKNVTSDDVKNMTVDTFTTTNNAVDEALKNPAYLGNEKYARYSSNYDTFMLGVQKHAEFSGAIKKLTDAVASLKINVNGNVYDLTKAYQNEATINSIAPVNVDTYETAKTTYEAARKVVADFVAKYGLETAKKVNAKNDADTELDKVVDITKDAYTPGTLEVYEKAQASIKLIDELTAKKDALTIDDYVAYMGLVEDAKIFTYANAFDNIGAYLTTNKVFAPKKSKEVADKYDAVKKMMATFKQSISKAEYAKYYGDQLKAAIAKIPAPSIISIRDKQLIQDALDILNKYGKNAGDFGITGTYVTTNIDFKLGNSGIVSKSSAAVLEDFDITSSTAGDIYLAASVTKEEFRKLIAAGIQVMTADNPADANYRAAVTALGNFEALATATALDLNVKTNQNYKDIVALEKVYNAALAKLTEAEKTAFNNDKALKGKLKNAASLSKELRNFEGITNASVVAKCEAAQTAISKMILKKDADKHVYVKDIYAHNKTLIDEVNGYFADEIVKFVYENATTANDFNGTTKKYDVATPKDSSLKTFNDVVAEYNAYVFGSEDKDVNAVAALIKDLSPLPAVYTLADVESRLGALDAAEAAYNKLTAEQKLKVKNAANLKEYKTSIMEALVVSIEKEMNKIVKIYAEQLDSNQVKVVADVDALLAKHAARLGKAYDANGKSATEMFPAKNTTGLDYQFTTTVGQKAGLYFAAKEILKNKEVKDAIAEIVTQYDAIKAGTEKVVAGYNNYSDATVVLDGIKAYNKLSDLAKNLLIDVKLTNLANGSTDGFDKVLSTAGAEIKTMDKDVVAALVKSENKAKSFFLENATVEAIADQQLPEDGSAVTPAVVVKDAMGNVIDAKNYKVEYANNTVAGTAKVIIDAVGTVYTGRVEATFNIVADAATVKPEKVTVKTDQGIIKVTANKVEGLSYRFMVKQEGAKNWKTINTKSNVATFTGLVKNARYEVKVATVLGKEVSEFNNAGFVYTNKLGNKSAMMYKAAINKVTIKKGVAKITAKNVAYKGEKYRVGYKKYGTKNFKWNVWGTNTVKTVKGLKKGVKYTFTIQYRYVSEVSGTYVYSNYSKYVVKKAK